MMHSHVASGFFIVLQQGKLVHEEGFIDIIRDEILTLGQFKTQGAHSLEGAIFFISNKEEDVLLFQGEL